MKRFIFLPAFFLLALTASALAIDYSSPDVDPRGICDQMCFSQTDYFGEVIGTIPCAPPGTGNSWVGNAYANGELILCKNVYPNTAPSQFVRINPQSGAVIATTNLPFNGYVMGCTFDGTNLWIAQWSPVNLIHCVSLSGSEISSFSPSLAGYSARAVGWDGASLWVGCNQSSNTTKLVKFSPTGVNLQEWTSGTAVSWYMDGEILSSFPSGSNLVVVENVGNTIKRLNVGTSVTIGDQVPSPSSGDAAEGIGFDGDYMWFNCSWASDGVIWKLSDGSSPQIPLLVTMNPVNPPITIPAIGGSFQLNATVQRVLAPQAPFYVWSRDRFPDGSYTDPLLGPVQINPPVGQQVTRLRTQNVPGSWPAGMHWYIGYANPTIAYPATDADSFSWTKLTTGANGPGVWDATCSGEPFPGEEIPPLSRGDRGDLVAVSPNPFNPVTALSYELRAVSYVSLRVYDTAGRLVSTLVEGMQEAGTHNVTFDGSKLASGIYLYTLNTGDHIITGKMTLIR